MKYSLDFIMDVLKYAKDNGSTRAARHFDIQHSTIKRWNDRYHVYEAQENRKFSEQQKTEILVYANEHGLSSAMREYNVDVATIREWNEKRGIYQQTGRRKDATHKKQTVHQSEKFKLEVLNFVKQHGISKAMRKYNLPDSTIRSWNKQYKVYVPRKARCFSEAEKRLIVKFAEEHSVTKAAHDYSVTTEQIRNWAQKICQKKL